MSGAIEEYLPEEEIARRERKALLDREFAELVGAVETPNWNLAACIGTDPNAWFPKGKDRPEKVELLQRICDECPIRRLCLAYGKATKAIDGVWGGRDFYQYQSKSGKFRSPPKPPPAPSNVKGVSWETRVRSWVVRIRFRGVDTFAGYHKDQQVAEQTAIALRKQIIKAWEEEEAWPPPSMNARTVA
jgi:hypothetical protein